MHTAGNNEQTWPGNSNIRRAFCTTMEGIILMERTLTIEVPESIYDSLVRVAEQKGQTPEELAVEWLGHAIRMAIEDPVENFIGAFASNIPDWSDQHDKYIEQTLIDKMVQAIPQCPVTDDASSR